MLNLIIFEWIDVSNYLNVKEKQHIKYNLSVNPSNIFIVVLLHDSANFINVILTSKQTKGGAHQILIL